MENHLSEDQRKAYVEIIRDAERRFEKNFDRDFDSLKREFAPKLEARSRVRTLFDNVRSLRTKLSEALLQLQKMGFRVDDGMIAIDYEPQDGGRNELEEVKRDALQQRDAMRLKFRKALFDVLGASSADDARHIVEEVM